MAAKNKTPYRPNRVTPPGEILAEALEERGLTQADLSERIGMAPKTINQIIKAKAPLTPETAAKLELILGIPAEFWNRAEQRFQDHLVRQRQNKEWADSTEILREVPYRDMVNHGWIQDWTRKVDKLRETLAFYGVGGPDELREVCLEPRATYRQSAVFESDPGAISAWLRQGELQAQKIECEEYDAIKFKKALAEIRLRTVDQRGFERFMVSQCAEAGVAVVFVKEVKRARMNGASRWATPRKALIQLSLRGRSDDIFWFSFFHEAGHILLHGKKKVFVDGVGHEGLELELESEADHFAAEFLIPRREYDDFCSREQFSRTAILEFAASLQIAPGIVVGRLQHDEELPHSHLNNLKCKIEWAA